MLNTPLRKADVRKDFNKSFSFHKNIHVPKMAYTFGKIIYYIPHSQIEFEIMFNI